MIRLQWSERPIRKQKPAFITRMKLANPSETKPIRSFLLSRGGPFFLSFETSRRKTATTAYK
jgi:hypothetical protein